MKKVFLAVMLVFLSASLSFAQISQGDPTATTIKTGNRPQAGTFGLYGGGEVMLHGNKPYLLPVINLKYFATDKLEIRASLDVFSDTYSYNGKQIGAANIYDDDKKLFTSTGSGSNGDGLENHFTLAPGAAYHFSNSNILDVYVGAEIPLGVRSYSYKVLTSGDNAPGGVTNSTTVTATPFHVGLNAIIGLQAFIGNLPLAIGFEYGIGMGADLGQNYKIVSVAGDNKATYYITPGSYDAANHAAKDTAAKYASLSASTAYIDHMFRLTLSYYFK